MEDNKELMGVEALELKFGDFLRHADGYFSEHSMGLIRRALAIAEESLAGISRYDGTPMVFHSTRTAEIVFSEIGLGRNSVISTLLHDVVRKVSLRRKRPDHCSANSV